MTPRIYQLAKEAVHGKRPDDFLLTRKEIVECSTSARRRKVVR